MNGTPLGRWATHGGLVVEGDLILSWTKNEIRTTEEYVCRVSLTTGSSQGAADIFSSAAGVPKAFKTFECRIVATRPAP